MNRTFASLLAACAALSLAAPVAAQEPIRRWTVVVVVPEQHLARRVPDPAVETRLNEVLLEAGFRVVDKQRIRKIVNNAVLDRLLQGGPAAVREALRIAQRVGADVVVTGEAFSQRVAGRTVTTDLGTTDIVYCRARLELRAYRADTGELSYSGSTHMTGEQEMTEELASKSAFVAAADELAPKLIQNLKRLPAVDRGIIRIEVIGLGAATGAALREELRKVPGVLDVAPADLEAGQVSIEITVRKATIPRIPVLLETAPNLKRFRLKVEKSTKSQIVARSRRG